MPKFTVEITVDAENEEQVEKLLVKASWVDSYGAVDEVDENPVSDDDDDEL